MEWRPDLSDFLNHLKSVIYIKYNKKLKTSLKDYKVAGKECIFTMI